MRLFVSYARVDKPYCVQIIKTLDVHQVWYDQRLHAGQNWWKEILKRLEWCDGFVYLLSPDSVRSEYCQKELEIATKAGKVIFPVIIQARTVIPENLRDYHHIDLSDGLTTDTVKALLNAMYIADRNQRPDYNEDVTPILSIVNHHPIPVVGKPDTVIAEAVESLQNGDYDRAVFLLKHAKENGYRSRYVDLDAMLRQAESNLDDQSYLREAHREYELITALMRRERTRELGCQAFRSFQRNFPDYDPDNLAAICGQSQLHLEWCSIPAGRVVLGTNGSAMKQTVSAFRISKYPVTNAQFQMFIDSPTGYKDSQWWSYSPYALEWHQTHTEALPVEDNPHLPRVNVCWYEVVAFCLWLSDEMGTDVLLPTETQWQRAAQGDDERLYPWGSIFDPYMCNARESCIRVLTPVNRYPAGASPYGVMDMAGNAWEWCMDTQDGLGMQRDFLSRANRAVRGGSYISIYNRLQNTFHYHLNPRCRYDTIGFRVVTA